jgi:hypothetical protein
MNVPELTFEEVYRALDYSPETGSFRWKLDPGKNIKTGDMAGVWKSLRIKSTGEEKKYLYITYKGRAMIATRLAWLLHYKEWPDTSIQFLDNDTTNLRIGNLVKSKFPTRKVSSEGRKLHKMSKEAQRHYGLKRYYGISIADYAEMFRAHNGKCAICHGQETSVDKNGNVKPLAVDHCHDTGAVRELLCYACNSMLGQAKDNVEVLLAGADYIRKHSGNRSLGTSFTSTDQADSAQTT